MLTYPQIISPKKNRGILEEVSQLTHNIKIKDDQIASLNARITNLLKEKSQIINEQKEQKFQTIKYKKLYESIQRAAKEDDTNSFLSEEEKQNDQWIKILDEAKHQKNDVNMIVRGLKNKLGQIESEYKISIAKSRKYFDRNIIANLKEMSFTNLNFEEYMNSKIKTEKVTIYIYKYIVGKLG